TASHGQVEVVREGTVSAAKVGDRLGVKDALQTQIGEADVAVEGVKLRLHEASRLELKQVEKRAMLARMRGGIESEVDQNARLDMEMEGSDAVAHSQGGHFFITADGRGVVAVATVTGTVHLYSAGATVDVNKGE